jgi:hypothetical protein
LQPKKLHLVGLILILALLTPVTAGATWGNKCSLGDGHHCYGIAEWQMSGSGYGGGEEVKGMSSETMWPLSR